MREEIDDFIEFLKRLEELDRIMPQELKDMINSYWKNKENDING